jgi:hypothetical protein
MSKIGQFVYEHQEKDGFECNLNEEYQNENERFNLQNSASIAGGTESDKVCFERRDEPGIPF